MHELDLRISDVDRDNAAQLLHRSVGEGRISWTEHEERLTSVYAAGMATVQQDARRFFAFLFLNHAALVLVGLELVTSVSLTAPPRAGPSPPEGSDACVFT